MQHGIIGNCAFSALIDKGSIVWLCWPRMDSAFVFASLLDGAGGSFDVEMLDAQSIRQEYVENTNILRTVMQSAAGSLELLDFAPRFSQYDRSYKPTMVVRILRPLGGEPWVRVRCRPTLDNGRRPAASYCASNHIEYLGFDAPVRLTTNMALTCVSEERPFALLRDHHLVLTWGQPLESPLEETAENFLSRTQAYWRRWVRNGRVPRDYQKEVIRSALVLKLHQYEDTGAILASTTTSIPEHPGSGRCWDYRYCWLRDAFFSLNAFERLGQTEEMEKFVVYLLNLCRKPWTLQPVYALSGERELPEQILEHLSGYRNERPVRIGNQAYQHVQNDVYGEMILAISRLLLDVRFVGVEGLSGAALLVQRLLDQIEGRLEEEDAGLWELRSKWRLHAFTLLMHWAGARRAAEIGESLGSTALQERGADLARRSRHLLETRCWSPELGALTQAASTSNLDSALLLAVQLGFFDPLDPRAGTHIEAIRARLGADGGLLRRYAVADDFGVPQAAFTVCSLWLAEALAIVGRREEAKDLFERILALHNGLGLFSEDILPATGEQSGNFPQTYSHVGIINTAFRLSRDW
jgi:GH15 family glucan-1,4-alpha-glucosidase